MDLAEAIRTEVRIFLESELKNSSLSEVSKFKLLENAGEMPADEFSKICKELTQEQFAEFFLRLHLLKKQWEEQNPK